MSTVRLACMPCLGAALLLVQSCSVNPVTGGQDFVLMSEEQEISLGRKYSTEIVKQMPVYDDPDLAELVQSVGDRLAANSHRPDLIYRFTVLDSTTVNAFALPGGYIYITRGLLAYLNSEAELAAVLGHEIGHVTARHSVRQHSTATVTGILGAVVAASTGISGMDQVTSLAGTAIVRGYGREHELEADRLGAEYMAKTGYDPDGMLQVVRVLKNQEAFDKQVAEQEDREATAYHGLFSTHPDNDRRLQEVIGAAARFHGGDYTDPGRERFLRRLDGLTFGSSAEEGIVREHRFYHGELDFTIEFPAGWRVENRPDRVVATNRDNTALIQLTQTDLNKRITPREFMLERMDLDDLRSGEPLSVNGFEGYTGLADGRTPWGTRVVRYAVIFRDKRAWIVAGTAKQDGANADTDTATLTAARSFRPLAEQEQALARAQHLHISTAPAATSYAGLAAMSPIANYPEQQLRLLNGQYPDGEPESGQLLKIVR